MNSLLPLLFVLSLTASVVQGQVTIYEAYLLNESTPRFVFLPTIHAKAPDKLYERADDILQFEEFDAIYFEHELNLLDKIRSDRDYLKLDPDYDRMRVGDNVPSKLFQIMENDLSLLGIDITISKETHLFDVLEKIDLHQELKNPFIGDKLLFDFEVIERAKHRNNNIYFLDHLSPHTANIVIGITGQAILGKMLLRMRLQGKELNKRLFTKISGFINSIMGNFVYPFFLKKLIAGGMRRGFWIPFFLGSASAFLAKNKNLYEHSIKKRNAAWLNTLLSIAKKNKRTLVVAGVLHFHGADSIFQGLIEQGYSIKERKIKKGESCHKAYQNNF